MISFNSIGTNGSLRIHTRANQLRTSSNHTFHEKIRHGVGSGINFANSALQRVGARVPGTPALSATLSDAARSLSGPSSVDGISSGVNATSDGDMGTLQSEMLRNNQEMLEQQVQVSRITTEYSTRSYILKAMFDSLKTIGSNIR